MFHKNVSATQEVERTGDRGGMTPECADGPQRLSITDVVAAFRRVRAIDAALTLHDMTAFDLSLLACIADASDATAGALAKQLGVTHSSASTGVDRLQARGLVRRIGRSFAEPGGGDRRVALIETTEQGRALLASLTEIEVEL
jgi:DNA-binding MarR family transcriptional regulator